jgi:hypothetical protein
VRFPAIAASAVLVFAASACTVSNAAMPRCQADQRLGLVAQSVAGAAYVPCIERLPAGWHFNSLHVTNRVTKFSLQSDRDPRPVHVELRPTCDTRGAVPIAPRADGVRSYQRTYAIAPRYTATIYDVFPGGCVTTRFAFERGAHITLIDEMQQAVQLYSRRELRTGLAKKYGINLDK